MLAFQENLMRSTSPAVRVFAASKLLARGAAQSMVGYDWLPWEVRRGEGNFVAPSHAFDAFSLGVLWMEVYTGRSNARGILAQLENGDDWSSAAFDLPEVLRSPHIFSTLGSLFGDASTRPLPSMVASLFGASFGGEVRKKRKAGASAVVQPHDAVPKQVAKMTMGKLTMDGANAKGGSELNCLLDASSALDVARRRLLVMRSRELQTTAIPYSPYSCVVLQMLPRTASSTNS